MEEDEPSREKYSDQNVSIKSLNSAREIPGDEIRKPNEESFHPSSSKQVQFNSSLEEKKGKNISEPVDGKTSHINSSQVSNSKDASPDDKRKK